VERDRVRIVQVGLLGFGSALQLGFFYGLSPMRGLELPALQILAAMGMRFLVLPFTGKAGPNQLIELIPGAPWLLYALALLLLLGVAALALSAWRRRDHSLWLLAAGVLILGVTLGAGMVTRNPMHPFVPIAGPRYNYLPLSLLGLLLIAACRPGPWRRSGLVAPALATIFLLVGTYSYFKPKWYYVRPGRGLPPTRPARRRHGAALLRKWLGGLLPSPGCLGNDFARLAALTTSCPSP
jgi:hypothetical protein